MSVTTAAIIGGGTALAGGVIGAISQGNAAAAQKDSASQELAFQKEGLQTQLKLRDENIGLAQKYGPMSPNEIASVDRLLATKSQALGQSLFTINKQYEALQAADPSVKQAGQNLFDLLQGKTAATLKPMQDVLDRQRTQLQSRLASQMGPGWQTSSAGIEAMTQFDQQTAVTLSQAQQQATQLAVGSFSTLFGQQIGGLGQVTQQTQNAYGQATLADQTALQAYQVGQNRETNAVMGAATGTPVNPYAPAAGQAAITATSGAAAGAGGMAFGSVLGGLGNFGVALGSQQQSQAFQQTMTNNAIQQFGQMYGMGGGGGYVPGAIAGSAPVSAGLSLGSVLTP